MQPQEQTVRRHGTTDEGRFRIAASAKAFEILSSGLYSNKVGAIVRELAANAVDAHAVAGKAGTPFSLHLPSEAEPYFAVRDFGPGLSPDQIATTYTTYFESDKTGTNDLIGALGLGAKSPLAYADIVQVTSWHAGTRSIYSVFKDEGGFPSLALMHRDASAEPSGVEVRFAVARADFGSFRANAAEVLRFFRTKPTVAGVADFQFQAEPEYEYRRPEFGLPKVHQRGYGTEQPRVIMGDVAYPLEKHEDSELETDDVASALIEHGIQLFVPIGAVDVTASREELSYSKPTIRALVAALHAVDRALAADMRAAVEAAGSFWVACLEYARWARLFDYRNQPPATWHGRPVTTRVELCEGVGAPGPATRLAYDREDRYRRYRSVDGELVARREDDVKSIPIRGRVGAIFLNDVDTGGLYVHCWRHMDNFGIKEAYILEAAACSPEFLDRAGFAHLLVRVSEIPRPERTPARKKEAGAKTLLRELVGGYWYAAEVDLTDGGVYLETRCDKVLHYPETTGQKYFEDADAHDGKRDRTLLMNLDGHLNLYGVRTADIPRVRKAGPWKTFQEHVEEVLRKHAREMLPEAGLVLAERELRGCRHPDLVAKRFAPGSVFGDYAKLYRRCVAAREDDRVGAFIALARRFPAVELEPDPAYVAAQEAVVAAYPLLADVHARDGAVPAIKHYIDLVDRERAAAADEPKSKHTASGA